MNHIYEEYGYYPLIDDNDFQEKLLYHTEFNELIVPILNETELNTTEKINLIKAKLLTSILTLTPYQEFVSRYISSYTPYTGLLLFHSPGSGKTLSVLKMIKNNLNFIINQNSYVYIIVSRKLLKQQWNKDILSYIPELMPYIKLITYKSLYNKTIGENKSIMDKEKFVIQKVHIGSKIKLEMDNCILILEEAHNLTDNNYTESILHIKKSYKNIKIIALTATPIKNMIDEIIDIFNFVIIDKTLNKKDYFKYVNGKPILINSEKLKKDITGYVSTIKINDSIYLSKKIEIGDFHDGLEYIKTIIIKPTKIQDYIIQNTLKVKKDSLGRIFESLSNIFFPYINNKNKLVPVYGNSGYELVKKSVIENKTAYNNQLSYLLNVNDFNLLNVEDDKLTGKLFSLKYIKIFSAKIYYLIKLLRKLNGNIFIYSNYKLIMIDIIREVLINDGYEDYLFPEKGIESQKRCYSCLEKKINHTILSHSWSPIRFFICDSNDNTLIDKISLVFNSSENLNGKLVKIILSSQMINEGINLKNVIHVIKLDASLTMARNEQIERRAIRLHSHNDYILQYNKIPNVYIYNFALKLSNNQSNEIHNYLLCEKKYKDIIVIDKILEEASIDFGVYNSKTFYNGKINNMTKSLVEKENRIDIIINYLLSIFKNVNMIKYQNISEEINSKFNNISIILALKYLLDNEKIFISKIQNDVYIFSNLNIHEDSIDKKFLNIDNYYNINKQLTNEQLFYDIDYITSKKISDIRGIISDKFKLKFSNFIIEKLKLNLVKIKSTNENLYLLKGWICSQSINKETLKIICNFFKIKYSNVKNNCNLIKNYLYNLEKYNNKNIQYLIYPKNHSSIIFPLNIYDYLNVTKISYESKNYQIINFKQNIINKIISYDDNEYDVIKFEFDCVKNNEKIHIIIE